MNTSKQVMRSLLRNARPVLVAIGIMLASAASPDVVTAQANDSANNGGRQNVRRYSRVGVQRTSVDDQVKGLSARFALTKSQQSKVKAILERRDANALRVRADTSLSAIDRGHALYTVNSDAVAQIKAQLTPEQLQKTASQPQSAPVAPGAAPPASHDMPKSSDDGS